MTKFSVFNKEHSELIIKQINQLLPSLESNFPQISLFQFEIGSRSFISSMCWRSWFNMAKACSCRVMCFPVLGCMADSSRALPSYFRINWTCAVRMDSKSSKIPLGFCSLNRPSRVSWFVPFQARRVSCPSTKLSILPIHKDSMVSKCPTWMAMDHLPSGAERHCSRESDCVNSAICRGVWLSCSKSALYDFMVKRNVITKVPHFFGLAQFLLCFA